MKSIPFTKMQGAGNDFVVLDETKVRYGINETGYRWLADRHFGVGADQILTVRLSSRADVDFEYLIHNANGAEVEQCGNGARCFARYVKETGLTNQSRFRVWTRSGVITPCIGPDGRITIDMGAPVFDHPRIPFIGDNLRPKSFGSWFLWPIELENQAHGTMVDVAVLSMGNPHAVQWVDDVDLAPVLAQGDWIESHPRFPRQVNVGFMQVENRQRLRLRVFERGVGETLSCGTGACAAVVAGIRLGLLDAEVDVHTRGGVLTIAWAGGDAPVYLTGPAVWVFRGEVQLPDPCWE